MWAGTSSTDILLRVEQKDMPKLKPSAPKKAKQNRVEEELHKFKEGALHSGSKKGPRVTDRKQAIAIALSEAGLSKKNKKRASKTGPVLVR
jgi:hypothetical protein